MVSICLPTLNAIRFLKERTDSIFCQTHHDWELIVCDSYSNDGTWEYFQQFKSDSRIQLHQVPKNGLYEGWNESLRRAKGDYLYIAPADDTMLPTLFENCSALLDSSPQLNVAVCDFDEIDDSGRIITKEQSWHRRLYGSEMGRSHVRNRFAEFLTTLSIGTPWFTITSIFFRRKLLETAGLFPSSFGSHGDNLWTARAALASDVLYLSQRLATFRRHGSQATAKPMDPQLSWNLVCGFRQLLDDVEDQLPMAWTTLPDWRERLLAVRLNLFRQSLKLERWRLRQDPFGFLRSLLVAWRTQRPWLFRQAARGFSLQPVFDPVPSALSLVSEFLEMANEPRFREIPSV